MIYVTHDQTEALTFADQVVVMQDGQVVQIGSPVELFERPAHTFVGHFIGSPGMNIIPCEVREGTAFVGDRAVMAAHGVSGRTEIGIRPEFVSFGAEGLPAQIVRVADVGRSRIVEARVGEHKVNAVVPEDTPVPTGTTHLVFDPDQTRVYADGWLAAERGAK
jgi:glycerol transport system ATP-binding protein